MIGEMNPKPYKIVRIADAGRSSGGGRRSAILALSRARPAAASLERISGWASVLVRRDAMSVTKTGRAVLGRDLGRSRAEEILEVDGLDLGTGARGWDEIGDDLKAIAEKMGQRCAYVPHLLAALGDVRRLELLSKAGVGLDEGLNLGPVRSAVPAYGPLRRS